MDGEIFSFQLEPIFSFRLGNLPLFQINILTRNIVHICDVIVHHGGADIGLSLCICCQGLL